MPEQELIRSHLQRLREDRGWRQRDLSLAVGVDPVTIGRIERGERSIDILEWVLIARALKKDPSDMLREALKGSSSEPDVEGAEVPRQKAEVDGLPRGRQAQVAYLAAMGRSNDQIAERLGISPNTVGSYFKRAMEEAEVNTRTALATVTLRRREARLKAIARERKSRIAQLEAEVSLLKSLQAVELCRAEPPSKRGDSLPCRALKDE